MLLQRNVLMEEKRCTNSTCKKNQQETEETCNFPPFPTAHLAIVCACHPLLLYLFYQKVACRPMRDNIQEEKSHSLTLSDINEAELTFLLGCFSAAAAAAATFCAVVGMAMLAKGTSMLYLMECRSCTTTLDTFLKESLRPANRRTCSWLNKDVGFLRCMGGKIKKVLTLCSLR